jgi:putative endonuclease
MDDRQRKQTGEAAETAALRYLQTQGLQLVARNYRCKVGEIDLVMLDRSTLALIEVRFRTSAAFGGAAASVTRQKQRRITQAARHLITTQSALRRYPARFDVIAITAGAKTPHVEWIQAAFSIEPR